MELQLTDYDSHANETLEVLAEICLMLISSGAHNARIIRNVERIATGLGYNADLLITFNGITITIYKEKGGKNYSVTRSIKTKGINFETVSEISILSWDVFENKISLKRIAKIITRIKRKKIYSKIELYLLIPLASVALCRLFEGDWLQAGIAFISTLFGFSFLRFLRTKSYNAIFSVFLVTIISVSTIHFLGSILNLRIVEALSVSVLYLVPGVLLINSFIDYFEGFIEAGNAKLVNAFLIIFAIASGFFFSNLLFEYGIFNHTLMDLSSFQQQIIYKKEVLGIGLLTSKFLLGGITSLGFATMFNTPKRALWVVILLGGIGFALKYFLNVEMGLGQIPAVFCASSLVGISGMYFAHRTHTPPLVFTVPAVINMIPGMLSYKFMVGMINWIMKPNGVTQNVNDVLQTFETGISAIFIVFALAFGVAFPIIVFKSYTVKGKDLNRLIEVYFKKKPKE